MRALWHWMKHEMYLQFKNGMYVLYILVNLIYLILLRYVPNAYKEVATTLVLLTDPTFLGMIFVGGILLLEKQQGMPKGIGVTPLGVRGYIVTKVSSLLVISLMLGTTIGVVIIGLKLNIGTLLIGIGLGASLFTLMGIIIGCYTYSINQFLIVMSLGCIVLAPPFLNYLGIVQVEAFNWIPTYSVMCLIGCAIKGEGPRLSDSAYLLIWLIGMYGWTKESVAKKLFC